MNERNRKLLWKWTTIASIFYIKKKKNTNKWNSLKAYRSHIGNCTSENQLDFVTHQDNGWIQKLNQSNQVQCGDHWYAFFLLEKIIIHEFCINHLFFQLEIPLNDHSDVKYRLYPCALNGLLTSDCSNANCFLIEAVLPAYYTFESYNPFSWMYSMTLSLIKYLTDKPRLKLRRIELELRRFVIQLSMTVIFFCKIEINRMNRQKKTAKK